MSEQSVTSVYELFEQQVKLSRSIGATRNALKTVNRSIYEKRLEKLNLNWGKFKSNHRLIVRDATESDKNHTYFKNNINKSTEKKYQQSREYVYLMLEGLKPTEQQSAQMQTQQSLTNAVVKGTAGPQGITLNDTRPVWDGVLEWNSPINVRNGSEQKQLRKVQCQISVYFRDGKPEIDTALWARTMKLGFMVKQKNTNVSKNSTTLSLDLGPHPDGENWKSLQVAALIGTVPYTDVPSATGGMRKLIFDYSGSTQKFVGHILNKQSLNRQCSAGTVPSNSTQADRPKPGIVKDVILPPSSTVTLVCSSTGPVISGIEIPVAGPTANHSPICPSVRTPESQGDGTRAKKWSGDDIIITNVINKRNSLEIKQPRQPLDSTPAVGDHPRTAVGDVETTQPPIRQIQEETVPSNAARDVTSGTNVSQNESHVSETNRKGINGNEGTDNGRNEAEKQNPVADTATIPLAEPGQKSQTSEPQGEERPEVAGVSSAGTTLESAEKFNLQQIEALEKAMDAAKEKEAQLQQALVTVRQEKTDIGRKLTVARKQGMQYKRQGKKCDVNDIKVKYQRRSNCHSRET